jgi:hypothetical protein
LVKRKVLPRENNAHFKDYEIGDKWKDCFEHYGRDENIKNSIYTFPIQSNFIMLRLKIHVIFSNLLSHCINIWGLGIFPSHLFTIK